MNSSRHWHDFSVYRVASSPGRHLITASDPFRTPLFFVSPALYAGKNHRPDITLHRIQPNGLNASVSADGRKLSSDEAKLSPVVATAHWRHTRKNIGLAFGDPGSNGAGVQDLHWEQMTRQRLSKGKYTFTLPPPEAVRGTKHFVSDFSADGATHRGDPGVDVHEVETDPWWESDNARSLVRSSAASSSSSSSSSPPQKTTRSHPSTTTEGRRMTWKRTHSVESGLENAALYRVMSASNFKLVDDATGNIAAVFETNGLKSFRKVGRLRISTDENGADGKIDEDLLLCAVLTYSVIDEQRRRDG